MIAVFLAAAMSSCEKTEAEQTIVFDTDLTFECAFTEIKDISLKAEVTPSVNSEYYYCYIVEKEKFSSEEDEMGRIMREFIQASQIDGVELVDVIQSRSKKGKSTNEFTDLNFSTEYYVCVFQLNAEGKTGNFAKFDVTTASDIDKFSLEITVDEIACWSANVGVKSSDRFEKFLYDVVDAETFGKFKTDEAYIKDYLKRNKVYLPLMLQKDESVSDWEDLYSDTEYYVLAFGYNLDENKVTTSLIKKQFKTEPLSYIQDFSLEITILPLLTSVTAAASLKPTSSNYDEKVLKYFCGAFKTSTLNEDLKSFIQKIIDQTIDSKCSSFPMYDRKFITNTLLSKWNNTLRYNALEANTEYTVFGVLMDSNGKIAGEVFTKNFTTKEYIVSSANVDAELLAYYDGDEVVKLQQNALYPGNIILKTVLSKQDENVKKAYYTLALGDYTDENEYPDIKLISSIINGSPSGIQLNKPMHLFVSWPDDIENNKKWTMLTVGMDENNNYTKVTRKIYEITREGADDPQDYLDRKASAGEERAYRLESRIAVEEK